MFSCVSTVSTEPPDRGHCSMALAWRDGGSEEMSLPDFPVPTGKLGGYVRHGEVTMPLVPVLISECGTKEQSKI